MSIVGVFFKRWVQAMNATTKYPWMRVALCYGLLCPSMAGLFFLILSYIADPRAGERIESLLNSGAPLQWGDLIVIMLFPIGGIIFFGIPYLIFALFFIGFKVHKGWHAYGLAAIWGSFLGLFMFFGMKPPYAISNVEAQAGWMAALSLALAGVLVTYWVVPPKVVEADGIPPNQ